MFSFVNRTHHFVHTDIVKKVKDKKRREKRTRKEKKWVEMERKGKVGGERKRRDGSRRGRCERK